MDCDKTGQLIFRIRKEKGLTQKNIADSMNISDKTVSKWERGLGCPDVSLLPELANILGIDMETLLSGDMEAGQFVGGNMKNIKFYVCPSCGNLLTSTGEANISCCGKKISELEPKKAAEEEKLTVELIENDYYITSNHEMTKENYIPFVALLNGDTLLLKKQYPEWGLQVRIPRISHGKLVYYSTTKGLFYQIV
ncbi:ribosome-binding protein aMBF1 (putative translation factor) [Aequitasia blattaphilus]|uniref:Helix-turn-helix domain-containing protein n=1 Tax=Aequitasia blattaphilus TaxID=2949332 RepID=A0ABT1E7I6_9FIRM|nr:helix-turn-helix domain-containing protein [Aequitasia blattaphilus]MCP1101798.1 helix-turn-helix domain-containing protein [Aequitasia blattaphilus]MCR8614438.1 helix-turn-helix domain-containing protein [Aequitasia blattaphilus]